MTVTDLGELNERSLLDSRVECVSPQCIRYERQLGEEQLWLVSQR